ncbi:hepatocyte cell adhesion molecule-like isoform X2 [Scyliorhinus canicula]|uniref:hepatocyte cell adhesion molecule-like isoform X2 n=1 Tax=Scyliorhinus canicula TaxID=7830 RepID=UPI0018F5F3E7|nr:hepatocyte cell adhesion molecule-like isoform X2 [Scyliorhinus canicula]
MANKKKKQMAHNVDMKNLDVKILTLHSVFHLLTLCKTEISANTVINAAVGEQVLFPVHNQCGAVSEVTFLSKSPINTKLASWSFNTSDKQPLYENRLKRSRNGSVMLHNVQIHDTKLYQIEIECYSTAMTAARQQLIDLRVFEPVSKPLVTTTCSTINATLSCTVSNGTNVTFHWGKQSLSGAINRIHNGTELIIDIVNEQEQFIYKCVAENPVSNATSVPWTMKECNKEPSKACILLGISIASVWLLVLVLIACICYKMKQIASDKGCNTALQMRNEETSYLRDGTIEATYITRID